MTRVTSHHRFFHTGLTESGSVSLEGTEAHHLVHVMRHQLGDEIELFNGSGLVATGTIVSIRKRDAEIKIGSSWRQPAPAGELTLATAVPKGDRFDWLVEKATELGVTKLIPILTSRSVVDPRDSKLDKLRNVVVGACKQSGRNHLMEISAVTPFSELWNSETTVHRIFIAHPQGKPIVPERGTSRTDELAAMVVIGPEGGFSDDEIQLAIANTAEPITLGPNILRIETAAVAVAAKLLL